MSNQLHQLQCDILVAGGGPSGVSCALAAARQGAKVVLCQDRPVLGGNASSEVRMHIVGADGCGRGGVALETEARETGIIEELRLEDCVTNPQVSASVFDAILYDKCVSEPNLTLLLNTTVVGVEMRGEGIEAAFAQRHSTEDDFRIEAALFIDCTGDGRLGAEAGADFRRGREAASEYGETLAGPVADQKSLGSTLLFQGRRWSEPQPYTPPAWARKFTREDLARRLKIGPDTTRHELEYGYWWLEWGGELDTLKDNEEIRHELMAILFGVWDYIKNQSGFREADYWALEWMGALPGKRESRRFLGHHVLSEKDVLGSTPFEDAIAYGGWPIDTHPPGGVDAREEPPCVQHQVPYLFDIPLRACLSRNVKNLLFAGRNISATHIAFASTRVMATCSVLGQGVGTVAAHAVRWGVKDLAEIPGDCAKMKTIRQSLLEQDCFLIGVKNEDEADLARSARLSASSWQSGGEPKNLLSGHTRAAHGTRGVAPGRMPVASHRWMSDPESGLPAWIELEWDREILLQRVHLVFDTGLHRLLSHTHSDWFRAMMLWGKPQPETVRDYTLSAQVGGNWREIVDVKGNYQRLRRHLLASPVATNRLRLTVHSTNGIDHARVVEIRAYE